MKASMNSSATATYEGKLVTCSMRREQMPPILWAPCGSCSEEMIMNENVQPCWYRGGSTSTTANERDDLPLGALDGPGLLPRIS